MHRWQSSSPLLSFQLKLQALIFQMVNVLFILRTMTQKWINFYFSQDFLNLLRAMACLYPCPSGKLARKATCLKPKTTRPGQPDGTFFKPCLYSHVIRSLLLLHGTKQSREGILPFFLDLLGKLCSWKSSISSLCTAVWNTTNEVQFMSIKVATMQGLFLNALRNN